MKLFDLLGLLSPTLSAADCKLHMAVWNGEEHPLDVFIAGDFEEWQRWQSKRNFERRYVASLISMPGMDNWLFGGLYERIGVEYKEDANYYYYDLKQVQDCAELSGRLVVKFGRKFRQSYLLADRWSESILVSELKPERLTLLEFPEFIQAGARWRHSPKYPVLERCALLCFWGLRNIRHKVRKALHRKRIWGRRHLGSLVAIFLLGAWQQCGAASALE